MKKILSLLFGLVLLAFSVLFILRIKEVNENQPHKLEVHLLSLPLQFEQQGVQLEITSVERGVPEDPQWYISYDVHVHATNTTQEAVNIGILLDHLFEARNYADGPGTIQLSDAEIERRFTLSAGDSGDFIVPMDTLKKPEPLHTYLLHNIQEYEDKIQEKAQEGILYYEVLPLEGDFNAWK